MPPETEIAVTELTCDWVTVQYDPADKDSDTYRVPLAGLRLQEAGLWWESNISAADVPRIHRRDRQAIPENIVKEVKDVLVPHSPRS